MKPLRVLMVEDSEDDALLVTRALRMGDYAPEIRRVETADALRAALEEGWDVVISDYALPRFDGLSALRIVRQVAGPELPFVLVSGTIGEERAVAALKSGAGDFVTKQNLARLVPAIERELADAQVRRERRETLEQLEAAVSARDQFLSIASHELRTPLTSLQLQVQSLLRMLAASGDHPEPGAAGGAGYAPRMEQKLKTVSRSTERLSELVNRLLDVSRITSGNPMHLDLESFDLAELVREVVARFGDALRERRCEVRIHAPAPVPGTWDRMRVDTVVTNLLSNAIKYGEGRPIEVEVTREGDAALLAVRDHGIGIHPDDQARIFGRFERAVPERHYGGFGIGLWVARLVAEAHGGKLRVSSAPGAGATFTLELPPKPPAPELAPDVEPGTAREPSVPGTLKEAAGATDQRSADGQARTGETP